MNENRQPQNKKRRSLFYLLLIAILLVVNGVLFFTNMKTNEESEVLTAERNELLEQKADYERMVDSLKTELSASMGINEELDSIISIKVRELDSLKVVFSQRVSARDVEIGRMKQQLAQLIAELEQKTEDYTAEIEELKRQYAALEAENEVLTSEVQNKNQTISTLESQIARGAVLTALNVSANGIQFRGETREKVTDRAKRTDKLRVCFNLAENRIARPGYRDIYLKITSPEGTTLSMESMGSGTFQLAETGETSLFTTKLTINYDPSDPGKEFCSEWYQDNEFMDGIYTVELYQNGYLIGTNTLELKKGGLF